MLIKDRLKLKVEDSYIHEFCELTETIDEFFLEFEFDDEYLNNFFIGLRNKLYELYDTLQEYKRLLKKYEYDRKRSDWLEMVINYLIFFIERQMEREALLDVPLYYLYWDDD